jgi:hypothetical protein
LVTAVIHGMLTVNNRLLPLIHLQSPPPPKKMITPCQSSLVHTGRGEAIVTAVLHANQSQQLQQTMLTHTCASNSVPNTVKNKINYCWFFQTGPCMYVFICVCVCVCARVWPVLCIILLAKEYSSSDPMKFMYLPCKWKNVLGLNSWLSMWSCFSHTSSSCCLLPGWCSYNYNNKNYAHVWSQFNWLKIRCMAGSWRLT